MKTEKTILLTVDVEDWFQVENFRPYVPFDTWDQRELRVERNVHSLLNLFDSVELAGRPEARSQNADGSKSDEARIPEGSEDFELPSFPACKPQAEGSPKATFFVLGWIAERLPGLVREIQSRGHEIASHGFNHIMCNRQTHSDLKKDLTDSKKLLEDITGSKIAGFRAPNFSIDNNTLIIIKNCGYLYDSSYNSFGLHSRYGKISLNGNKKKGIACKLSDNFFELPISNLNISYKLSAMSSERNDKNRFVLPWGGGGYFRLIPHHLFNNGVQSILKKDRAFLFYMHPWEIDPKQPKVKKASLNYRFRHYINLKKTMSKLTSLIEAFPSCRFITCSEYLKQARKQKG
jgi:polysaccharide deacetylase family protein (PEP-CTERM system associated)